jgi:uncharacterized YccA/Bax inhibitor family protein
MRTSNPALKEDIFTFENYAADHMTLNGTVFKTGTLLALTVMTAAFSWNQVIVNPQTFMPYFGAGVIGGLVIGYVTIAKKNWSPVTAPLYALLMGLVLGGISALFEAQFQGIVVQAVGLTFGTMAVLLILYVTRIIRPTEKFKMGVVAATGAIFLFYMASFVLGLFGINVPLIHSSGTFGIAFSVFVVVIAALNLILDFETIENGVNNGAPKYLEWYAAFGLMVTLVWLYLEILRLLAKLNQRR